MGFIPLTTRGEGRGCCLEVFDSLVYCPLAEVDSLYEHHGALRSILGIRALVFRGRMCRRIQLEGVLNLRPLGKVHCSISGFHSHLGKTSNSHSSEAQDGHGILSQGKEMAGQFVLLSQLAIKSLEWHGIWMPGPPRCPVGQARIPLTNPGLTKKEGRMCLRWLCTRRAPSWAGSVVL